MSLRIAVYIFYNHASPQQKRADPKASPHSIIADAYLIAIASISTSAPIGNAATW